jgi:tetratricopeptide (TPR) repeat protein
VLKQNPSNAIAHFDLAVSEQALGGREEAIRELEATLVLAPYYARAEEMLASLYLESKDFEHARTHLNNLIQIDPTNYIANYTWCARLSTG